MQDKYVIYCVTNLENGKQYIGQTKNFRERWKAHLRSFAQHKEGKQVDNSYLSRSVAKYGIENFEVTVLTSCRGVDNANYLEMYFVKELGTFKPRGYNLTLGGGGTKGFPCSEKRKKQQSEYMKGEKNSYYGKKHTEEIKDLLREQKGIKIIVEGVQYNSILECATVMGIGREAVYNMLRDGEAHFLDRESGYHVIKKLPKRKFRKDRKTVSYADVVLNCLRENATPMTTLMLREILHFLHEECVRKGLRELEKAGLVVSENAKLGGKHSRVKLVKLVPLEGRTS